MNKIIIYFSYSGHTREIANKIKLWYFRIRTNESY